MTRLTDSDAATVQRLYREGLSQAAIGAEMGVPQTTISRFMRANGMRTRPNGPKPNVLRIGDLRRMAEDSLSQRAIAARLGISQSSVCEAMKRYRITKSKRAGAAPDASPSASTTTPHTRHSETEPDLQSSQVQS